MKAKSKKMIIIGFSIMTIFLLLNSLLLNNRFRLLPKSPKDDSLNQFEGILYPAIGCPMEIVQNGPNSSIGKIILTLQKDAQINNSVGLLVGRASEFANIEIPLHVIEINKITDIDNQPTFRFAQWVKNQFNNYYEITFKIDPLIDLKYKKNILFDLHLTINGKKFIKNGSVFISTFSNDKVIFVASDIHISERWDKIQDSMNECLENSERHGKSIINYNDLISLSTFNDSYINPNSNFISFIKKINELHSQGKLDMLILTGDLVDYKFINSNQPNICSLENTEWSILLKILEGEYPNSIKLNVPAYIIPGNHDYRLYPYRVQAYGIKHCGIPIDMSNILLQHENQTTSSKYRLEDLNSIRIDDGKNHSLNYYYLYFNPFSDFIVDIPQNRLVFLDSQSDAFCHASNIFSHNNSRLIEMEQPPSNGLDNKQINFLNSALDIDKTVCIFTHSPIISTETKLNNLNFEFKLFSTLNKKPKEFELGLFNKGLCLGAIYNNQYYIIKNIIENKNSVFAFSGHCHRMDYYKLNKETYSINRSYNEISSNFKTNEINFFLTGSLGHISTTADGIQEPGYRSIIIKNGKIDQVNAVCLDEKPFNGLKSFLSIKKDTNYYEVKATITDIKKINLMKDMNICLVVFQENKTTKNDIIGENEKLLNFYYDQENNKTFWVYEINKDEINLKIMNSTEMPPNEGKYLFSIGIIKKTANGLKVIYMRRLAPSVP